MTIITIRFLPVALLLLTSLFPLHLKAQSWYRDSTFGLNGIALTGSQNENDQLQISTALPDGKILLISSVNPSNNTTMTRLNPDGSLDSAFGSFGKTNHPDTYWAAFALQPDGKMLMAGRANFSNNPICGLFRYLPDGTPDSSFSADGLVDSIFGEFEFSAPANIVVLSDGRILVSGIAQNDPNTQHYRLTIIEPDGTRDLTFSQDGFAGFSFPFDYYQLLVLQEQTDGKILAGGNRKVSNNRDFVVLRFLPDGELDPDFGTNGEVGIALTPNTNDYLTQILEYPDGKLLCAGSTGFPAPLTTGIVRLFSNGMIDPSFGQSGKITFADASLASGFAGIRLLPDGKILTILKKSPPDANSISYWIKRFLDNGQPDNSPDANAFLTDDIGASTSPGNREILRWLPGDGLLYAGSRYFNNTSDLEIVLARYNFDATVPVSNPDDFSLDLHIRFSPNPGKGAPTLLGYSALPVRGTLTVVSATGALLLRRTLAFGENEQLEWPLPEAAAWPAGVYGWSFIAERGNAAGGLWVKTE